MKVLSCFCLMVFQCLSWFFNAMLFTVPEGWSFGGLLCFVVFFQVFGSRLGGRWHVMSLLWALNLWQLL